jgi:AraC family ethanolamine operon transcriptional activator
MKTVTFTDFDAFSDNITDVDCVMTMHNPAHRRWSVSQAQLPDVHIQWGKLGSGNIVEGQSWPHGYLLYLPLTSSCDYSANGTSIKPGSFMILEPGCEFCVSTRDQHDWCSIFIPEHILTGSGGIDDLSSAGSPKCRVSGADHHLANQFLSLLTEIFSVAAKNPEFEASQAASVAQSELVRIAAGVLDKQRADTSDAAGRPKLSREEIMLHAKEHLERFNAERHFSVARLATAVGVSERTLRTAFHQYYWVGPKQYLRLRQANRVYRTLREKSPGESTVADILLDNGVWEHSRFASLYHRLFGQHPSETLRSVPR